MSESTNKEMDKEMIESTYGEYTFRIYIPKTKTIHYEKTGKQPIVELDFTKRKVTILKERCKLPYNHILETYDFNNIRIMQYIGILSDCDKFLFEGDVFYDEDKDEYCYIAYDKAEIKLIYNTFTKNVTNEELRKLCPMGDIFTLKNEYPNFPLEIQ